jgi:hypothetical protein
MRISKRVLVGLAAIVATAQAMGQQVAVSSGGHATPAKQQVSAIRGLCKGTTYELQFDRAEKKVLVKPGSAAALDLTNSPFGKTFTNGLFYGKFGLDCDPEGLKVVFMGYQTIAKAAPKPVSYVAVINDAGKFVADSGLRDERSDMLEAQPGIQ